MPDITMCTQTLCPNSRHCYRVRAWPNPYWQAYMAFPYEISADGVVCSYYMPMRGR